MSGRPAILALAVALFGAASPATAAERLVPSGSADFPLRSFVLTPDRPLAIDVASARVTENGVAVPGAKLASAGSAGGASVVMLVIDASESMRGAPIQRAMGAARALAARRPPGQRLGVVLFNNEPRVALAPTADKARIDAVLSRIPTLEGGTRIFDATVLAAREVDRAAASASTLIVLSDGDDTGSTNALAGATGAARRAGARVYTVGLRSEKYDAAALRSLASAGRGEYREAAAARDLRGIFDALGARFSTEYLLEYRSIAEPRTRVEVRLTAPGLADGATGRYVAPAGALSSAAAPQRGFWAGDGAIAAVALALGVLTGLLALLLLHLRRRRHNDLTTRIAAFGMPLPEKYTPLTERHEHRTRLDRLSWWVEYKEEVDVAQLEHSPKKLLALATGGLTIFALLVVLITGAPILIVIAGAGPFLARAVATRKARIQRDLFSEQLVDTLQGTASALRAGHSISSALAEVTGDAAEPTRRELGQVVADERLGKALDDGLRDVARRMRNRDVEQIALVAQLQRSTGANMAEVLDRVSETVRERHDLHRMIRALTAQGRMARGLLTALPPALVLTISIISPGYMSPLFEKAAGIVLLVIATGMTIAGSLVIKKIVEIEV